MELIQLYDLAAQIGPNGAPLSSNAANDARDALQSQSISDDEINDYIKHRLEEVLREETGRIRGCSTQNCSNPAVWSRVFEKIPNVTRMLADVGAGLSIASAMVGIAPGILVRRPPVEFDGYSLGQYRDGDRVYATQFGCWAHLNDFVSIPTNNGRFNYLIVGAVMPKKPPHKLFGISGSTWEMVQLAARAQNLGDPEGPRGYCGQCGLPHCPFTLVGLKSGEGDDYWRVFCEYCQAEVTIKEIDP